VARHDPVLITGCSSGIGRATALLLAGRGWRVYATARRVEAIADLEAAGCRFLPLDVTDETSMAAAVREVESEHGAVGALVNNAGYSQHGALETLTMERVRAQFDTNVFGPLRLAQLVLPGMRARGWGRIVNVSSMGGRLVLPGEGAYHGSKWALEALSDALRFEVAGFGVEVIVVEPGPVAQTGFAAAVQERMAGIEQEKPPYGAFNRAVVKISVDALERSPIRHVMARPEHVAGVIAKALTAERPRPRYRTDWIGRFLLVVRRLSSSRMWDRGVGLVFPKPGDRESTGRP
jgi:NAD(P)-dependent dehydrogenase (short-subunit alcohol dehydrogenase family)